MSHYFFIFPNRHRLVFMVQVLYNYNISIKVFFMFGVLLIILGGFFIAQEAGWIQGGWWGYIWGVLLILIGINILIRRKGKV